MTRGKKTLKPEKKANYTIKNWKKMPKYKNAKICHKIAIFLNIAKNRGQYFPEGQVPTVITVVLLMQHYDDTFHHVWWNYFTVPC